MSADLDVYLKSRPPPGFEIIYVIERVETGKKYVGRTKYSANHRFQGHKSPTSKTLSYSYLDRSIQKHGANGFKLTVAKLVPSELAAVAEVGLMDELQTVFPNGYNLVRSGTGPQTYTEATKQKMSAAAKVAHNREGAQERRVASFKRTLESNPESRKKFQTAAIARSAAIPPEVQKERNDRQRIISSTPEVKNKQKDAANARWKDPEYVKRHKAGCDAARAEVLKKAKQTRASRTQEENDSINAKKSVSMKKYWEVRHAEIAEVARRTALPYQPKLAMRVHGAYYVSKDGLTIRKCSSRCLKYVCDI